MESLIQILLKSVNGFMGFFIRADRFSDTDEIWFARSAFIYTYIGAFVAFSYAVFYWTFHSNGAALSLGILSGVLIATTPLHLFGKSRLLAKINLASTSVGLAGTVLHMGGIDSSAACWLLGVTPGITALLFRRAKEIFQLTGLTLCLYFGIFAAELSGYQVYQFSYNEGSLFERIYTSIHFAAFSIFIAGALAIFATTQRELLKKVERQARDVKAILANIRQGIFTISSTDLSLGDEYSDYLVDIVQTKDIQHRNIMDLIFARSNLNTEQKDMTTTIIANCIQESSLNFSVNEQNLVRDLVFTAPDGHEKILLVDWQPIVNEKYDTIEKILVTLLDVTELKKMEAQNKKQQRVIEIISEIAELSQDKFEQFMKSSARFIDENHRITESSVGPADLKILFINMHTLKGAARTYRFKHMTAQIHECEQYYAQVQRGEKEWDRLKATEQLKAVHVLFDEYSSISHHKLNRGQANDHVKIDLEAVRENIRLLQNIEGVAFDDRLTPFFQNVKKTFYGLYYIETEALFQDIFKFLPSLAKDLHKLPPITELKSAHVGLNAEGCEVIRNSFVHILRNSMDHGLEETEIRAQKGKNPQGKISIDISVGADELLHIRYRDDGAGLALEKIREIGARKGLIGSDEMDPKKIAELIFNAGLSTAKAVTDISGRGVGMGAVREFFEQLGGRVELHLMNTPEALEPTPFGFLLVLPKKYFIDYNADNAAA